MPTRILCVAEKSSIAKAVANHLSGGTFRTRATRNQYIKNYDFSYTFPPPWGASNVTMTAVSGHVRDLDFTPEYTGWRSSPPAALFEAPIRSFCKSEEKKIIVRNIEAEAKHARGLFIWTDCDREGEFIGTEIRDIVVGVRPHVEVRRARFSNVERAHVRAAAQGVGGVDERAANAVAARSELDLRIGAAFTRWQTLLLQQLPGLEGKVISYGSCQFPTLGFVVERYKRVKNFVPEPFWSIKLTHNKEDVTVTFSWDRNRLFDRMMVLILYERCLAAKIARVTTVVKKPARKWKPLPLTTVELQKLGSRFLHMPSDAVMRVAEKLYTSGFISYPRTETDQFDRAIDLRALIGKQTPSTQWGPYAQSLLDGAFSSPRAGRNDDHAHPPIHPVAFVAPGTLNTNEERSVYEFIVRRYLACCSPDAIGESTTVSIAYGEEGFHANGLVVRERGYLDVYPYERWESSQPMPAYREGEQFVPDSAEMTDGKTSAPGYLTEPELIALMDVNGIGTDATMAEHIAKIKEREYVFTRNRGGGHGGEDAPAPARGRGRGRGDGGGGGGGGGVAEFIPSNLGIALVEGYDEMGFEDSLAKPFLRKEMEVKMKRICEGTLGKRELVEECVEQYRDMFVRADRRRREMMEVTRRYLEG